MNIFTSNSLIFNIIFLKTESNLRQPRVERQEDLTSVEAAGSENEEEEIDGGDSEAPTPPSRSRAVSSIPQPGPSLSDIPSLPSTTPSFKWQRKSKIDFEETLQDYFKHKKKMSLNQMLDRLPRVVIQKMKMSISCSLVYPPSRNYLPTGK